MAVIPDTDVNLATEVRDVLSAAGGSVDDDLTSFFKSEANINKWARYKPTIYYGLNFPTGNETPKQWQAGNGLCGFKSGSIKFNDTSSLVTAYRNNATYVYELPTGGVASPYRLGDFRGYKTDAIPPIWNFEHSGQMASNNPSSTSTFKVLGNNDIDSTYNLQLKDIVADADSTSLSGYHFGVVITNSSYSVVLTKKHSSPIGTAINFSNNSVTVTQSEVGSAGKYYAYPALIDSTGRTFVACPVGGIEFQILTSVDANRLGWMADTGRWSMAGRFTYSGQLGYSTDLEGANVYIALQVNGVDTSFGETVKLAKTSQSSDGKTYYMDYSRTVTRNLAQGETYRLRCGYGSNYGNNAYLTLKNPDYE